MMVEDTRAGDVKVAAPATTGPASDHDLPKLGGNPSKSILIPGSPYPNIPEEEAWPIGRLLFTWMKPLFRRAATLHREGKALEYDDLIPLVTVDHSESLGVKFEDAWRKQAENEAKAASVAAESESEANNNSNKRTTNVTVEDLKNSKDFGTKKIQKAVSGVMGRRFVLAGAVKALNTSLQFSFPLLLNAILRFIEDTQNGVFDDSDPWYDRYRGYWLAALLFLVMGSKAITESKYFHMVNRSAFRAKAAISAAVYNKSLRLSSSERQSTTLGELVNLMQVDASKIEMFIPQVHVLWDGMFQIFGYMTILYTLIGWPCFAGLVIMVMAGPIQGMVMKKLFGLTRHIVKYTDKRVESTNEALQGIESVKMQTWEDSVLENITKQRAEELKHLQSSAYLRGFSRAYMGALPGIVAVVSFIVYALAYQSATITASTLFAALVAFDQLRFPLLLYPMALAQLVQARVSASRLEVFLDLNEIGGLRSIGAAGTYKREYESEKGTIVIRNATVYWTDPNRASNQATVELDDDNVSTATSSTGKDKTETDNSDAESGLGETSKDLRYRPILRDVDLDVSSGDLTAIVGRVGSGKSTLVSTILGETFVDKGEVVLRGKVAYAAQTPWILNATVRDNICFGLPLDESKYYQVIKACQLEHDLAVLTDGDMTEIGEKGINLSGGQKARISVARAAYSSLCGANTIILDDPLSALDPEVAKNLFLECIVDLMAGKTVILVTNQIQFLSHVDRIVALRKGSIIEQGTYSDLIANEKSEINRLLKASSAGSSSKKTRENIKESTEQQPESIPMKEKQGKALVTKEERNTGAVSLQVYLEYISAGGGLCVFALVYFGFILSGANGLAVASWVSYWTSDPNYEKHSLAFYLGVYFTFTVTLGIFTFCRAYSLASFGVKASASLHKNLLDSILHAPMSFFNTTPLGRIVSRFSKDLYSIDLELVDHFDFFLFATLNVVISIGTILFVTPWFGVAVVPLGILYFRILNYFRDVSRETKRLDSITRSPVYALFSETLGGLETIRAFAEPERFKKNFGEKVDSNTRANYNNKSADRWLSVRLELIGSTVAGLAAAFASQSAIAAGTSDSSFASLAGLSLTFAISVTSLLNFCVRSFATLEAGMNSVERVIYYTESIPHEAPRTSEELEEQARLLPNAPPSKAALFAVQACDGKAESFTSPWPEKGAVALHSLKMSYREDTPLVLKGVTIGIEGGSRIGVVGRTGSGKSSLLLTLLRLVEPTLQLDDDEPYSAPILIDGVDILRIGLKELRSNVGIIPQNPVLFSGTIRTNIDPFRKFSDEDIWNALEQCGLKEAVEGMPEKLDGIVSEYGQNLSAGMRQQLVLGRALLRQCRILLLDEATSSVDFETDKEIQRTIRENFTDCTVITIAHRINTIMDSSKILVMRDGLAAEFDTPENLLKDETSLFSDIVRHAQAEENKN